VRYVVDGELRDVFDCHCERCRRFTGHHMAASAADTAAISVEDEGGLLRWYRPVPDAAYAFCSACGSSLFWRASATPERTSICAGTLDQPTGLRTVAAWWVSEAGDYYTRPTLPEYERE
jgi:hypothetical protein